MVVALLPVGESASIQNILIGHLLWSPLGGEVEERQCSWQTFDVRTKLYQLAAAPYTLSRYLDSLLFSTAVICQDIVAQVLKQLLHGVDPA